MSKKGRGRLSRVLNKCNKSVLCRGCVLFAEEEEEEEETLIILGPKDVFFVSCML